MTYGWTHVRTGRRTVGLWSDFGAKSIYPFSKEKAVIMTGKVNFSSIFKSIAILLVIIQVFTVNVKHNIKDNNFNVSYVNQLKYLLNVNSGIMCTAIWFSSSKLLNYK